MIHHLVLMLLMLQGRKTVQDSENCWNQTQIGAVLRKGK